ncbi:DUF4435 domain-containing protein [Commensalibacter sp. M0402]|uniref:DUF4435 domain-containing protein n=1 Tax=Commensalibacter TaxID=1079922 RepID=UPI0018DB2FB1|nr:MULTISPECIES: DUF4435 domain-containing protein [Commensalibacter]MBI0083244.1 DUF4435 domain-containing protein [Commensalibacter sp. W6292M3]MBI0088481.1 DUF4435 domain-containing protein [Commensalibacter melissae]
MTSENLFEIPVPLIIDETNKNDSTKITLDKGEAIYIVGANGSGKTHLARYIEQYIIQNYGEYKTYRINAHRAIFLNIPQTQMKEAQAKQALLPNPISQLSRKNQANRLTNQFDQLEFYNDSDELLQYLFSQSHSIATNFYNNYNPNRPPVQKPTSKLEQHLHPSILTPLWNELKKIRPDCAFITISHDLNFIANQAGKKYILKKYQRNFSESDKWDIKALPDNMPLSEEIVTLILGSRRPIFFVEGQENSLDQAVYRACYPEWTIIPSNSCTEVIHAVNSLNNHPSLTRINCAGIVDADYRGTDEIQKLNNQNIYVLNVLEIENLFLLYDVLEIIAELEQYNDKTEKENLIQEITSQLLDTINKNRNSYIVEYGKLQLSRSFARLSPSDDKIKKQESLIEFFNKSLDELKNSFQEDLQKTKYNINKAIEEKNIKELLKWYNGKGEGLSIISKILTKQKKEDFLKWIKRLLENSNENLIDVLKKHLPEIKNNV